MSDIDPIETARELATHANDIQHLQDDMDKMVKEMQEIKLAIQEIQKTLGFCSRVLIDVCKERKISACGFVWRYKTSNYLLKIEIPKVSIKRLLIQYDKKMNIINEFKSLMDAHKTTNVSRTAISNNLSSLSKSAGGFIWKYKQLNN